MTLLSARIMGRTATVATALLGATWLIAAYPLGYGRLGALLSDHLALQWLIALTVGYVAAVGTLRGAHDRPIMGEDVDGALDIVVRYVLIVALLDYGLGKFTGGMWPAPSPWTLDSKIGDVSAFRLAWSFFGIAPGYQALLGALEVIAAILLLSRRFALAGGLLSAGLFGNIIAIDYFYAPPGVLPFAVTLGACSAAVVFARRERIGALLAPMPARGRAIGGTAVLWRATRIAVAVTVAIIVRRHYLEIGRFREASSPLEGRWEIAACDAAAAAYFCAPVVDSVRPRLYLWGYGNGRLRSGVITQPLSDTAGLRPYSHTARYGLTAANDSVTLDLVTLHHSTPDTIHLIGKFERIANAMTLQIAGDTGRVRLRRVAR